MQNASISYPHFIQQAYQAEVLLRKVTLHTVGTRYPMKDQLVISSENIIQDSKNPLFSYTQKIDVVVKCENRLEAIKLNQALREYLAKDMMLPLSVGVFQKPFTKDNQKSRKHFAYSNISAKELLAFLPQYEKDMKLKSVVGASIVESNYIFNGFDLTYSITNYTFEATFMSLDDLKKAKIDLDKPIYRLALCTTSIVEEDENTCNDELTNFEINGESQSEIEALAVKLSALQNSGVVFTCKGQFPRQERDFYRVTLSKSASDLINDIDKLLKPISSSPDKKAS